MSQEDLLNAMMVMAEQMGIRIPRDCLTGVQSNIDLLLRHAAIVAAADDPMLDPAEAVRL